MMTGNFGFPYRLLEKDEYTVSRVISHGSWIGSGTIQAVVMPDWTPSKSANSAPTALGLTESLTLRKKVFVTLSILPCTNCDERDAMVTRSLLALGVSEL